MTHTVKDHINLEPRLIYHAKKIFTILIYFSKVKKKTDQLQYLISHIVRLQYLKIQLIN